MPTDPPSPLDVDALRRDLDDFERHNEPGVGRLGVYRKAHEWRALLAALERATAAESDRDRLSARVAELQAEVEKAYARGVEDERREWEHAGDSVREELDRRKT